MKPDIHPAYNVTTVTCGCGNTFTTRSTSPTGQLTVEVCSACHPFYTGKQKILDTGGRVARFEKRFGKRTPRPAPPPTSSTPDGARSHPAWGGPGAVVMSPAGAAAPARGARAMSSTRGGRPTGWPGCSPSTPRWSRSWPTPRCTPTSRAPAGWAAATPSSPRSSRPPARWTPPAATSPRPGSSPARTPPSPPRPRSLEAQSRGADRPAAHPAAAQGSGRRQGRDPGDQGGGGRRGVGPLRR